MCTMGSAIDLPALKQSTDGLLELCKSSPPSASQAQRFRDRCAAASEQIVSLQSQQVTIAVCGEGNVGKSTIVNAIMGGFYAPSSAVPSTSAVTLFHGRSVDGTPPHCFKATAYTGKNRPTTVWVDKPGVLRDFGATMESSNGKKRKALISAVLEDYVVFPKTKEELGLAEEIPVRGGDGRNHVRGLRNAVTGKAIAFKKVLMNAIFPDRKYERVEVDIYGNQFLLGDLTLADIPGFNQRIGDEEIKEKIMRSSHAILYLVDGNSTVTATDFESLRFLQSYVDPEVLFIAVNKLNVLKCPAFPQDDISERIHSMNLGEPPSSISASEWEKDRMDEELQKEVLENVRRQLLASDLYIHRGKDVRERFEKLVETGATLHRVDAQPALEDIHRSRRKLGLNYAHYDQSGDEKSVVALRKIIRETAESHTRALLLRSLVGKVREVCTIVKNDLQTRIATLRESDKESLANANKWHKVAKTSGLAHPDLFDAAADQAIAAFEADWDEQYVDLFTHLAGAIELAVRSTENPIVGYVSNTADNRTRYAKACFEAGVNAGRDAMSKTPIPARAKFAIISLWSNLVKGKAGPKSKELFEQVVKPVSEALFESRGTEFKVSLGGNISDHTLQAVVQDVETAIAGAVAVQTNLSIFGKIGQFFGNILGDISYAFAATFTPPSTVPKWVCDNVSRAFESNIKWDETRKALLHNYKTTLDERKDVVRSTMGDMIESLVVAANLRRSKGNEFGQTAEQCEIVLKRVKEELKVYQNRWSE